MPSLQKLTNLGRVQEVVFHLPENFTLPPLLYTLNETDFANVLQSASKIIEFQKQTAFSAQQDNFIQEKVAQELVEKEEQIHVLKKQYDKLQALKEREIQEQIEKTNTLQLEVEKYKMRFETIQETITEQTEKRVDEIRTSKDNHIHDLKENMLKMQMENQTLLAKLEQKTLAAGKSQKKGAQGEVFFQETAKETIDWNLTLISKSDHTTDLKLEKRDVQAFFELKNYNNPPPHEQYKKFLDNMNLHTETDIGFYISLKSAIPFYEDLTIEWTATHQMLVVVPKFLEYDMHRIFHEFDLYVGIARKIRHLVSQVETNDTDGKKLERITTYVQNMLKRVDKAKKEYDVLRKQLQASVDSQKQHVEGFFEAQLKDINSTLAIIGDTEEHTPESIAATDTVVSLPNLAPERKKRKPKAQKLSE